MPRLSSKSRAWSPAARTKVRMTRPKSGGFGRPRAAPRGEPDLSSRTLAMAEIECQSTGGSSPTAGCPTRQSRTFPTHSPPNAQHIVMTRCPTNHTNALTGRASSHPSGLTPLAQHCWPNTDGPTPEF